MDYRIKPVGDSALTIIFGNTIDPGTSRTVRIAREYLAGKNIGGVSEYVQTYASLMVHYSPSVIGFSELAARIITELSGMEVGSGSEAKRIIEIRAGLSDLYARIYAGLRLSGRDGPFDQHAAP